MMSLQNTAAPSDKDMKSPRGKYLGCRARESLPYIVIGVNRVCSEASVMCFMEPWLYDYILDSSVSLAVFQERNCTVSSKKKGGGVVIYVNNK